jgi:hypothetical protein
MPDFRAKAKKPYGSRTLEKLFTLAHKVIHSFCVKRKEQPAENSPNFVAFFLSSKNFPNGIKALA